MQHLGVAEYSGMFLALVAALGISRLACSRMGPEIDQARLGSLDGLRAFLALGVLIAHFPLAWAWAEAEMWHTDAHPIYAIFGLNAVAIFFMITGFLFYGKIRRTAPGGIDWRTLYRRRLLRLFPMYFVAISMMVVISFGHQGFQLVVPPRELVMSLLKWLTFTLWAPAKVNDYAGSAYVLSGVIWTLRYEWLFYALLPVLAVLVPRLRQRSTIIPALLVAAALLCATAPDWSVRGFGPRAFGPFFLGMIVVEIMRHVELQHMLRSRLGAVLAVAGLVCMFALDPPAYGIAHGLCLLMVFAPITAGFDFRGLLVRREVRLLGDASYSFYLLHGIVLHVFFWAIPTLSTARFDVMMLFALPVLAALTATLSIVTYLFIEKPFIALGVGRRRARVQPTAEFM